MKKLYISIALLFAVMNAVAQGAWTQKADFGGSGRYGAIGFSIDTMGYISTGIDATSLNNDLWEWNATNNIWTQKADFPGVVRRHPVAFVIGNKGYLGTGTNTGGTSYYNDFYKFDPAGNTWTAIANFGGTPRFGAVAFAIGTKGYVGTGKDIASVTKDFWMYDTITGAWTQKTDFGGAARVRATGFAIPDSGKGYIGTGTISPTGPYYKDFWEYDTLTDAWTQKTDFGGTARKSAVGLSVGILGYIGTGNDGADKKDFWEYDLSGDTWTAKANYGGAIRHCASGFSIGTKAYIGTGIGASYLKDFWEWDPAAAYVSEIPENPVVNLFPNPVVSELTIEIPDIKESQKIEILNSTGQIVYSSIAGFRKVVNMSDFPSGIYLVKQTSKAGIAVKKIVKQ
ncbi:MAG: T9SS type A sorting domain-containing protein [Bacteroidota bacterium]